MRVCHLNDRECYGGAGRAANRLHSALRQQGIDSHMLVQSQSTDDPTVHSSTSIFGKAATLLRPLLDYLPREYYRDRTDNPFSPAWLPERRLHQIREIDPEVVHCHWIAQGFIRLETLSKIDRPIVWTLHDMWPFTGGCHYSHGCERYTEACGNCPELGSNKEQDLSRWIWERKESAWSSLDLTVVTPSTWLAERARESSLLENERVEVIPNPIDANFFRPYPRSRGRELYNLPDDRPVILFGAMSATTDRRKGFHHLQAAIKKIGQERSDAIVVVFGANRPDNPPDLGLETRYLGYVDENTLPLVYSCADVMVLPSEIDNLPNTMVEAMSCGTPCIAFDVGGIPELIDHQRNGYLANPYDATDLADGILWVLDQRGGNLSTEARQTIENRCAKPVVADQFKSLYSGF